jgi:hypothetical protein
VESLKESIEAKMKTTETTKYGGYFVFKRPGVGFLAGYKAKNRKIESVGFQLKSGEDG